MQGPPAIADLDSPEAGVASLLPQGSVQSSLPASLAPTLGTCVAWLEGYFCQLIRLRAWLPHSCRQQLAAPAAPGRYRPPPPPRPRQGTWGPHSCDLTKVDELGPHLGWCCQAPQSRPASPRSPRLLPPAPASQPPLPPAPQPPAPPPHQLLLAPPAAPQSPPPPSPLWLPLPPVPQPPKPPPLPLLLSQPAAPQPPAPQPPKPQPLSQPPSCPPPAPQPPLEPPSPQPPLEEIPSDCRPQPAMWCWVPRTLGAC
jgi:hypothetical protein